MLYDLGCMMGRADKFNLLEVGDDISDYINSLSEVN